MIILGLDPGSARTGYALIDTARRDIVIQCGCLTTLVGQELPDRLLTLGVNLTTLLVTYRPERAVIETVFFGRNVTTAMATAQARGVLVYVLRQHSLPIDSLTPLQIKSRLTGYGQATKQQVQRLLMYRLRLTTPPTPDDAADALAAAVCIADVAPQAYT